MKHSFWKTVLAVIVGTFLASIICTVICIVMLSGLGAEVPSGNVNKPGILKIDLSKVVLAEQKSENLTFNGTSSATTEKTIGIMDAVNAVKKAASDPNVKHIYLKTDGNVNSIAHCEELRKALSDFRTSGKGVIAYMDGLLKK